MAPSMLLPLRSTQVDSTWAPLETRVRQIESQKGSFRTVTERRLQEDIEKARSGNVDVTAAESEESDDEDESPETKQKRLWEAREEMLKELLRAQNETLTALDSISLLLSGHHKAGAGAKSSMSPALSSVVPISTLDAQRVRAAQLPDATKQLNESLYMGYRLDSLNRAIDKINSARSRLSEQAKHESAFWKQIADLSAQGLVISRLPRDSRISGVHFGFPEAAPRFRNRGFAVLHMDQNGQLRLDQAAATSRRYTVQISTLIEGRLISRSRIARFDSSEPDVAMTVAALRRSLFEEELFFEIGREARTIANQGVTVLDKAITADISDGQTLRIELVELDQESAGDDSTANTIADGIALGLRGLLSKGHEQSLARRSQSPAPLMPKGHVIPEYALLRPLLSHMRHYGLVSTLRMWCSSLKMTMNTAGVSFGAQLSTGLPVRSSSVDVPSTVLLLDNLLAPAGSTIKIALPTGTCLKIEIRTHLASPAFGTVFTASPIEYASETITPPRMPDLEAAKSAICSVLTADVVKLIVDAQESAVSSQQRWTSNGYYGGEVNSQHASLHIRANPDTSLALRYCERTRNDSPVHEAAWVWHAAKISDASTGTRNEQGPQYLMEIVTKLSKEAERSI